jgi:Kef-type K+ transport system membrane component KefB
MEPFSLNILNLLGILVAAWVGGAIARRVGYPAILGEIIIGIILGPSILGWLNNTDTIKVLSEVGIILLMVYIGIQIDFHDLKKASWAGLLAAIGGFVVPFFLGYYAILKFGGTHTSGLFVGLAVGVTALAANSRILIDLKLLDTRVAYVLMAGALISDTLALLVFAGIVSFADAGSFDFVALLIVAGKALAFFAVTIFFGLYVLPPVGKYFSRSKFRSSTFYFTVILIVGFGYAELAELAGMHSILGAFMAGLFIKDNLFPKNISQEVHKAFYDVSIGFLAPIFFVSAGFMVSIHVFETDLPLLLTIIALAIFGKIFGTALFYLPSGHGWREALTVGTGMNGRGAVEIIIAGVGLQMGIIDQKIFSILVFMAILTTMTVPFMLKWTTNWLKRRGELVLLSKRSGYLIAGVNPISLLLAKHLQEFTSVLMIDTNLEASNLAEEQGFNCLNGNVLKEDVMFEAGAENIDTFIGFTANSEINILGAQLARDTFRIPKNHVLISRKKDGAGSDLLDNIKATSLFATGIEIDYWFNKITSGQYTEGQEVILERTTSRAWIKHKNLQHNKLLPLVVIGLEKEKRPYRYGDLLDPDEVVIYIQ